MSEPIEYTDYKKNPDLLVKKLNISREAADIYLSSEIIDPHTVSYVWKRVLSYDMTKRHKPKPFGIPFLSQVDFPRCREANMSGVVWDITTNPTLKDGNKLNVLKENIKMVLSDINSFPDDFQFVSTYTDYQNALKSNKTASWISIQGGQAIDDDLNNLDIIPEIHRITLIHFTKSKIGASSFDRRNKNIGLTALGKNFVEKMLDNKIIVDLSHINRKGFFDALSIVPNGTPVVVTHTGVNGVFESWRNIDDEQIKAIANTNGTIGIIYYPKYLTKTFGSCSVSKIIEHMEHVIKVAGEDFVTLGSDYDGMITLPRGFKDITYQPLMVEEMLKRKWDSQRIKKILGLNFLKVIKQIRP